MIKSFKSFGALALLTAAGCATPVGDSFTAFINEDGAGAVFEGVVEVAQTTRHFRQVEGAAAVERVGIDIGQGKRTETEVGSSTANRVETVTEVAELENGTRVYTEVKTIGTEQIKTTTTVVDGEFGSTEVDTQTAGNFQEFQAINRWDGTDGTGIINIETLGGIDMLTMLMGRVAILSGAEEGDAWDDAFDDYDDVMFFGEQAHVYSVESVGDADGTNGDGDEANIVTVKVRFADSLLGDILDMDGNISVGGTQAIDDLVTNCLTIVQNAQSINYNSALGDDDSRTRSLVDGARCPTILNTATLTLVDDVIASAELSFVRVEIDEDLNVVVATNADSTTGPTDWAVDPGYGYELITNCDNDGDGDMGFQNPTDEVSCRFIGPDNFESYAVGNTWVTFEDNQSQLKKYIHYSTTEGTITYTLNSWTNPAE